MQRPQPQKQQSEEEKKRLRAAAEALFLEIDSEFGKKQPRAPRQKPASVSSSKPLISEGKEANRIAELMGETSIWRPVGRVAHLVVQTCKCCKEEKEYLGSVLIRHQHKTKKYLWDSLMPENPAYCRLPQTIEIIRQFVEECPTCIRANLSEPAAFDYSQMKLFS